jgi:hypothetical protein
VAAKENSLLTESVLIEGSITGLPLVSAPFLLANIKPSGVTEQPNIKESKNMRKIFRSKKEN